MYYQANLSDSELVIISNKYHRTCTIRSSCSFFKVLLNFTNLYWMSIMQIAGGFIYSIVLRNWMYSCACGTVRTVLHLRLLDFTINLIVHDLVTVYNNDSGGEKSYSVDSQSWLKQVVNRWHPFFHRLVPRSTVFASTTSKL